MDGGASIGGGRRPALFVLVSLAAAAALAGVSLLSPPSPPTWSFPTSAPTTSQPSSAATEATPAPSDGLGGGDWAPISLPPYRPVASLIATASDTAGVALDSAFRLTSLGAVPAARLAASIEVTPSLKLVTAAAADGSVTITPSGRLVAGTRYRFTARAADGSLAGSWAFQAVRPLRVATTLPGDQTTEVPLDTGIEVTFDQDGVTGASSHFRIEPRVAGRYEQHGRTLVFVPDALQPRTVYTVTVTRGVGLAGSTQTLETDARFAFETGGPAPARPVWHQFVRLVIEAPTNVAPTLAVSIGGSNDAPALTKMTLDVFWFPTLEAAAAAASHLVAAPTWATWSTDGQVSTTGLERALRATLVPHRMGNAGSTDAWITLPGRLAAGWYLVDERAPVGRHAQAILQVTDVATYAAFTTTDAVFWVNDTAGGAPLAGATVDVPGGVRIGTTDATGILRAPIPAAVRAAVESVGTATLVVRAPDGRSAFVPVGLPPTYGAYVEDVTWGTTDMDPWWWLFYTDRSVFRSTDEIDAWGFLRNRAGGRPPATAELRLIAALPADGSQPTDVPPIVTVPLRQDPNGAFSAHLPIRDLPLGGYLLELRADGAVVDRLWIQVDVLRKPAYALTVATDRHVYVDGDPATATTTARFFDGTAVPGLDLRLSAEAWGDRRLTTDGSGAATAAFVATVDPCCREGIPGAGLSATPAGPEEGVVSGWASATAFASRRWLAADATATSTRASVRGTLSTVDLARMERDWATIDWRTDPSGPAVAGGTVTAKVVESIPVLLRTTRTYDFISKRVVSIPEYTTKQRTALRRTLTSDRSGRLALDFPIDPTHAYDVELSAADEGGHVIILRVGIPTAAATARAGSARPYLAPDPRCTDLPECVYRIGDPVSLTMSDGKGRLPSGGRDRYLFIELQQGLHQVALGGSPIYNRAFAAADVPNIAVLGVRFTGTTYTATSPATATFDGSTRRLTVRLTTDRDRYAPRDTVTLTIRTLDEQGAPTAASVALRVIDEKLYASGAAFETDPLVDLYRPTPSGLLRTYASHPLPIAPWGGGKGDTTGGPGRSDFRDTLAARLLTTDADGRATLTFPLSDDLTAWHVSASAMTADLRAGTGSLLVHVGQPFFIEAPVAPEYLVGDRPVLRLRAFGSGLRSGDPVTFTVASATLPLAPTSATGVAFEPVEVPLPTLGLGGQVLTIAASGPAIAGAAALRDSLVRTFNVVASRFTTTKTAYSTLAAGSPPTGGDVTTFVFSDAGRGRFVPLLEASAWSSGARVDQSLAAALARDVLVREFGIADAALPPADFDPARYLRNDLVGLLPYSGGDLALTARLALLAPDRFDTDALRRSLTAARDDQASTREQRTLALAGLAGLGDPVLLAVRAAVDDPDLTIRERLYLALAAATLGDGDTALTIERDLLRTAGEQLGPMVRLRVGTSRDDTVEATSLVALVAATIGDPVAGPAEAYVEAEPATDELYGVQRVVVATRLLERTTASPASFAYSVAGARRIVSLGAGESFTVTLTAAQRATLSLEPLTGSVGVATSWREPVDPASIGPEPDLTLTRRALPAGVVPVDAVVEVRLVATFGPQALDATHQVTELVPSGLAPLPLTAAWPPDAGSPDAAVEPYLRPWLVEGQRVQFAVSRPSSGNTVTMRYLARVVTPGDYTWEPALMQAEGAAESAALVPGGRIAIR